MKRYSFLELASADLVIDAIYESDRLIKNVAGEPLARLTGTGNQGGFRYCGPNSVPKLVVLYSTMAEADWPDGLDEEAGLFTYYGDNRKPGYELHDRRSGRGGNQILRRAFQLAHGDEADRALVPPFLIFAKGEGRDAIFKGLAVPGAAHLDPSSDLIAVWKLAEGQRFQNYKATFTVLNLDVVPRGWLTELQSGNRLGSACPSIWREWVRTGKARPLRAERVSRIRTKAQQLGDETRRSIAEVVHAHFSPVPHAFEHFAADIVKYMDPNVTSIDVSRPSRDGGRDAVGRYRIGQHQNCVTVDFAMEAKCYKPSSGLGVEVMSRLISRLRHRQFGILVTTSYLGDQPYKEIVEDAHPIIVCSGGDLAGLIIEKKALASPAAVRDWLAAAYPLPTLQPC
ncbi:restriction endonuclease [Alsobacter soli]|uniref:Restriction endonuclease n=1 Tax=Alsobacter soli TaxID=2109933 RepID=A0A2T1HMI0_9HYPH|nr:restriction endonuclease [Alsobacter soli]PSC02838.1 restriction endonuclease [Alsobacter soli]